MSWQVAGGLVSLDNGWPSMTLSKAQCTSRSTTADAMISRSMATDSFTRAEDASAVIPSACKTHDVEMEMKNALQTEGAFLRLLDTVPSLTVGKNKLLGQWDTSKLNSI